MKTVNKSNIKPPSYWQDNSGVTAVEFGFVALGFMIIVFAIIEASHALWVYNAIHYSAERASRTALVQPTMTDEDLEEEAEGDLVSMYVNDAAGLTLATDDVVTDGITFKHVTATFPYTALVTSFLPISAQSYTMTISFSRPYNWTE